MNGQAHLLDRLAASNVRSLGTRLTTGTTLSRVSIASRAQGVQRNQIYMPVSSRAHAGGALRAYPYALQQVN